MAKFRIKKFITKYATCPTIEFRLCKRLPNQVKRLRNFKKTIL